jgi:hypothetical protein
MPLTAGFSAEHPGLDFACPLGTPVLLDADGVVLRSGFHVNHGGKPGYGRYLRVAHSDGSQSLYAHLSRVVAQLGQRCLAGQVVALSGSTGNSTGPHLHYEYRLDGIHPVDPIPLFLAIEPVMGSTMDSQPELPLGIRVGGKVSLNPRFDAVNLRLEPSAESCDLGDLKAGTALDVLDIEGEWVKVGVWMNMRYLLPAPGEQGE